jgi:hypothetical protein
MREQAEDRLLKLIDNYRKAAADTREAVEFEAMLGPEPSNDLRSQLLKMLTCAIVFSQVWDAVSDKPPPDCLLDLIAATASS